MGKTRRIIRAVAINCRGSDKFCDILRVRSQAPSEPKSGGVPQKKQIQNTEIFF
jgi:hypothetical protein